MCRSRCHRPAHCCAHGAYGRIEAARAARRFPALLDHLADGSLTLTAVGLLAPHLTPENHRDVLDAARHKTKREIEHLVVQLRPQPPVAATIRKLPARVPSPDPLPSSDLLTAVMATPPHELTPSPAAAPTPPASSARRPAVVAPLAPEIYKVQLTLGRQTIEKLRRVQDLLRHAIPDGDLAAIVDRALTLLLAEVERKRLAATSSPRNSRPLTPGSRHIPAPVRRAVWARDEGRCGFVGSDGRCTEPGFLEFHHLDPYARGGDATVESFAFRCRAHNLYEAELDFGPRMPQRDRRGLAKRLSSTRMVSDARRVLSVSLSIHGRFPTPLGRRRSWP